MNKILYRILILSCLSVTTLFASAYINGGYETSMDVYKNSDYQWKFVLPWHRLELRFTALPVKNVDFFLKTYANVDNDFYDNPVAYKKQVFQLVESHIHYSLGAKDKINFYMFVHQLRFYLGDPLFYLVSADKDKWDEDSWIGTSRVVGSTVEIKDFLANFWLKAFMARMYRQNTDVYGARISEDIFKQILRIGGTVTYKKWQGGENHYNLVGASDIGFNLFQNNITIEVAGSQTPSDTSLGQDVFSYKAEYRRNFHFSDFSLPIGDMDFVASWQDIGQDFRAYCSKAYDNNREYDRQGYNIDTKYRIPQRAITFTYHHYYYKRHSLPYFETGNYIESYIEFIHDINLKLWYQTTHQVNTDKINIIQLDGSSKEAYLQNDYWNHFLAQIEMQNVFYHIKLQFKIQNMYTDYLRYIYGTEISVNITDKMKVLNRMLVVDEIYRTRSTLWSQLQYNLGNNADFYLSYGNENYVNDDLVNDGDFVDSNNIMEHKIHLYIKVSF